MELRHLRYFLAVVDAQSLTSAATKLRVAQPALSRQIRDLEDEVGVPLFLRSSLGVVLTSAGKMFLGDARALLASANAAVAKLKAFAHGELGELRIGYAATPTLELLPPALAAFRAEFPNVNVLLHDLAGDEITDGLREGRLDLAVVARPSGLATEGVQFSVLHRYPICLAMRVDHRLAGKRTVSLPLLASEKLVVLRRSEYAEYHLLLDLVLGKMKIRPQIAVECDGASTLITEIEAGRGVAIVPRVFDQIIGKRLKLRPLSPAPVPLEIGIARSTSADAMPAVEKFSEFLRASAKQLLR
jgi:DNA-binding transcriptional LysR family regulator